MIGNSVGMLADSPMQKDVCNPDPEDMLQRARKRLEACDDAERLLIELNKNPTRVLFSENSHMSEVIAFGSIQIARIEAREQVEYWLKEIDKE